MKKVLIINFFYLFFITNGVTCEYSDGILASFSKEHRVCSKYAERKANRYKQNKHERWDIYHDCRCDLYYTKLRNNNFDRALQKYK